MLMIFDRRDVIWDSRNKKFDEIGQSDLSTPASLLWKCNVALYMEGWNIKVVHKYAPSKEDTEMLANIIMGLEQAASENEEVPELKPEPEVNKVATEAGLIDC